MWRRPAVHRLFIFVLFFAVFSPFPFWMELSGGMENFNVATAVEIRRHGNWLLPTLDGEPRTAKPPLAEWITAWGMGTSSSMGWGARWPSLAMSCLMLVAVYELGRVIEDETLGLVGALVCGTTLMFLKFSWQASYDVQVALWVTIADVGLAWAVFRGKRWAGCAVAGAALGMGMMTKGPVALLQAALPVAVFVPAAAMIRRRQLIRGAHVIALAATADSVGLGGTVGSRNHLRSEISNLRSEISDLRFENHQDLPAADTGWLGPIALGVLLVVLISLPWPLYVIEAAHLGFWGGLKHWYNEITLGTEAATERASPWYSYLTQLPALMLPWIVWFISGLVEVVRGSPRKPAARRYWLLLAWLVLPMAVMWFFPKQRDRYLLPILGPASLIAAYGLIRHLPEWGRGDGMAKLMVRLHIAILATAAIGLPIWGALSAHLNVPNSAKLLTEEGQPWYSPGLAAAVVVFAIIALVASLLWYRRSRIGLIAGTVVLTLLFDLVLMWGYSRSPDGRSHGKEFDDAILAQYPDAVVYDVEPKRRWLPLEMLIYFNRDVIKGYDESTITGTDHPQVLIYPPVGREHEEQPPAPPGFEPIVVQHANTGAWWAFVRPAPSDHRPVPPLKEM